MLVLYGVIATCSENHVEHTNTMLERTTVFRHAFTKLREATVSFVMSVYPSVRPHGKNSAFTGWVLMKFDI